MKRRLRSILLVCFGAVFVVSAGVVIYDLVQYRQGEEIYREAEELVQLPNFSDLPLPQLPEQSPSAPEQEAPEEPTQGDAEEPKQEAPVYVDPYADALRSMDFAALREVNSEVLGWILIPGTVISYPVTQHRDNTYYLSHTWRKTAGAVGAIFVEQNNRPDFSDFNTIVYGHNMNNGSMFGTLKQYKKQNYWKTHPYVYVTDDNGSRCYQVFAAYEVSTTGTTYQLGFRNDESKQAFLDFCMEQSLIQTGVVPTVRDHILTLSTCTGRGHATRWIVQAVLKAPDLPQEPEKEAESGGMQESLPTQEPDETVFNPVEEAPGGAPGETPDEMQSLQEERSGAAAMPGENVEEPSAAEAAQR